MHVYTCIIRFMHDTAKRSDIQGLSQKRSVRAVVFDYGNVLCLEQTLEDMKGPLSRGWASRRLFSRATHRRLHSVGFLADTTDEAAEIFFPGYAHTFTEIGKERGWPPSTRAQFDAVRGPSGALLIGDAKTVAKKILYVNEVLGGISRVTFQMGVSTLPHEKMLHAIEILGTQVAPIVRSELSVTPLRA
jgi:hypothetical protein